MEYTDVIWLPWQQKIFDLLAAPVDPRKIHWVVDVVGNHGKSYLAKYIALTRTVIIAEGKKTDVFNQILSKVERDPSPFDAVILDIPRDGKDYVNYGMIEKVKQGLIYSGKYEGGTIFYPITRVFVFANFEPDFTKWSKDRYDLIYIEV